MSLVLVTNDDGFGAPGLQRATVAIREIGHAIVVAPKTDRSGASHGISLGSPLRVTAVAPDEWMVDGSPADCSYVGLTSIAKGRVDFVVSGINWGANLAHDVRYSGTFGGAAEGAIHDKPAIAISQVGGKSFDAAAHFLASFLKELGTCGWNEAAVLNINVPANPERSHWTLTRPGRHSYGRALERRTDPRGADYFWIGGGPYRYDETPGTDCYEVRSMGRISVTCFDAMANFAPEIGDRLPKNVPGYVRV